MSKTAKPTPDVTSEVALLYDLAALIRKYGPETFEALAADWPRFAETLGALLAESAQVARAAQAASAGAPKIDRAYILDLRRSEPERGELLLDLYEGLAGKIYAPSLKDLRAFAETNGLADAAAQRTRARMVASVLATANALPVDLLREFVESLRPDGPNDLQRWSDIIEQRP